MVDKDGKKLSKSQGAALKDLFDRYGADVLRWWVCSIAYENDVKVDEEFFKLAGESYRTIRNRLRFLLSNLSDFTHDSSISFPPTSLEAWVLGEFEKTRVKVVNAYNSYAFHEVHKLLYNFCNNTLSGEYLSAVKDRLYCDAIGSDRRRRAQQAMFVMCDGICKLLAPVMCHTADEAYRALHGIDPQDSDACVHLTGFPDALDVTPDAGWAKTLKVLDDAMRALEAARADRGIDNPLDAGLVLPDADGVLAGFDAVDLADYCGVSRVTLKASGDIEVTDLSEEPRCERSWKRDGTVKLRSDGGMLSDRDAAALGV
jgi:isoleucyl-tRNA synthetase